MSGFNWRTKPMIMYKHCIIKTETFKDAVRNQIWSRTLKTLKWTHRMNKIFTNMEQWEYLAVSPFCKLALYDLCAIQYTNCIRFIIRIVYELLYELYSIHIRIVYELYTIHIRIVYESHTNCIRITYELYTNLYEFQKVSIRINSYRASQISYRYRIIYEFPIRIWYEWLETIP